MSKKLKIIGIFGVGNAGEICVHAIDHTKDRVLASMNGASLNWYTITERSLSEFTGEEQGEETVELGFLFGSLFVPFSEVMCV